MRLLIVEDEKELCDTISKSLYESGYEVDTCYDGHEALDYILTEDYDLIVLDLNLPGMDGMDILRELRKENEETKVLIHVLVPERSDKDEYLTRLADFIHSLDNVEKVEILPYHTMGIYKWKELGLEYPLEGIDPPTKERVENAKKILAI